MVKYDTPDTPKCPYANQCIGFARLLQTDTGIVPCSRIFHCPYAQNYVWEHMDKQKK